MSGHFHGKSAIITGGGSGIGRALGEELVRRGARVWLAGLQIGQLEETAARMQGPGTATPVATDVSQADQVAALVQQVHAAGGVDFMFNNAGVGVGGQARDFSLVDWSRVVNVNLMGVIHGVHACYPLMVAQGHGHIINTSSLAGLVPVPGQASYCATKHAIVGLSHALRIEAKPLGVNVSVACPAAVDTSMFKSSKWINLDSQKLQESLPGQPMSAVKCAQSILRGVERNRATIAPGVAGVVWRVHRYLPWLTSVMQRAMYRSLDGLRTEALESGSGADSNQ